MLAFDQRKSFTKDLFGIDGRPSSAQVAKIADSKQIIFEGLQRAVADGLSISSVGLLVDEEFGATVARDGKAGGYTLAMPVEKSGRTDFEFEYGAAFADHIESFDPDYAKVLVRYNPEGDSFINATQLARLRELSTWLQTHQRRLLLELLVPAEAAQLNQVHGDPDRYYREVRPKLALRAMAEMQVAGIEPDIWKIEGMDRRDDYVHAAVQAQFEGRGHVVGIILGGGASHARVEHWLREEAGVAGFVGFAVGRTIWQQALTDWLTGKLDRRRASRLIADKYLRLIGVYESARADPDN